jgi:hypothetical protein
MFAVQAHCLSPQRPIIGTTDRFVGGKAVHSARAHKSWGTRTALVGQGFHTAFDVTRRDLISAVIPDRALPRRRPRLIPMSEGKPRDRGDGDGDGDGRAPPLFAAFRDRDQLITLP